MKCSPGVLVQSFVELPNELLEDRAHRGIVDVVGMEIYILESLHDAEEEPPLFQHADRVPEPECLQYLPHVRAESGDVAPQVGGHVGRVCDEPLEVVGGRRVESEARGAAQLTVHVLDLPLQLLVALEHLRFGRCQDALEPPQDGHRQDYVLVLAALEGVADQVGDTPYEADDLAVVHEIGG